METLATVSDTVPPFFDAAPDAGAAHLTIAVAGADELAMEICRLGRAAGHDIVNLSERGRPDRDERWTQGVEWTRTLSGDPVEDSVIERSDVLVALSTASDLAALLEGVSRLELDRGPRRLVHVVASSDVPGEVPDRSESIELVLPLLAAPPAELNESTPKAPVDDAGDGRIPVGQAAMAVLRAAVEPDREGHLGPDEVAELGRSVMIQ